MYDQVWEKTLVLMWGFLVQTWWFWLFLLGAFVIRILMDVADIKVDQWLKRRRYRAAEAWRSGRDIIRNLRDLDSTEFEDYVADLFRRLGYQTKRVGQSHDGGVDVEIVKDGIQSYIQCKQYFKSRVGVGEVRDFYGALADRLAAGKGYFVTTSTFTLEAEKFAEDKPLELIDQSHLLRLIELAAAGDAAKTKPAS
jgi:restriction endonuclease Mrr